MDATRAWCAKTRGRFGLGWKQERGRWFCPDHGGKAAIVLERDSVCVCCGGARPVDAEAGGWSRDDSFWSCLGCRHLSHDEPRVYAESALSDVAAAKTIIRCCDEIDDRYNRLAHDQAIAESKPYERRIEAIGKILHGAGGEHTIRAVLLLVGHDADVDLADFPDVLAKRSAALRSHVRYIDRAWTGIGTWQG
jgi:hypothetical protein